MKTRFFSKSRITLTLMVVCGQVMPALMAQDSNPPVSVEVAVPAPAIAEARPVQLSPGVAEILKLARAHMSDDVIVAFIRNSGSSYHLSAAEIVYLRQQGLSEQVVTIMLSTAQNAPAESPQYAPQAAPAAGTTAFWANSNPQPSAPAPAAPQPSAQPAPVYQAAPTYAAAATVYAQPAPMYDYATPTYGYYDSWPYY